MPGYKRTEVGVVPEDWEVKPLQSLAEKIMVGIASAATHAYRNRGIVMFRNQNIKPGYLDDSDLLYIAEDYETAFRNKRLKGGDLLTARTGYPGTTSIVPPQYEGAQSFTTLITRPRRGVVDSEYLCAFINSEKGQQFFEQNQIGGGQKNVNAGSLKKLPVAFPPTTGEQEAIVRALNDVDALLATLDQMIAKKRDLKQAAMQQLLTGETRLPGFSGNWEMMHLGEIAHIKTGSRNNEDKVEDGQYPFFVRSEFVERINSYSHDCEAILVPGEGRIGDIFHYINGRFDVHQRVYAITKFSPGISGRFVYFYLSKNFGAWAMQNTVKATVDSLRLPTFQTFEMRLPPTLDEQIAIANALSDIDGELCTLENRRDKTRNIKQAMMQELLTGKTRLV